MQVLFSICYLLAIVSVGLVYPSSYGHDFLNHGHTSNPVGYSTMRHDSEEVGAAKAVHFAAHAEAKARLAYGHGAQDEPIDTPEVQIAKFQHQIVHVEAKQRLENPLDTPEVQVTKQEHFAKHTEEKLRNIHPAIAHAADPVDTAEVQQHFHAKSQAQLQQADGNGQNHQHTGFGHLHVHAGIVTPIVYKHHHRW